MNDVKARVYKGLKGQLVLRLAVEVAGEETKNEWCEAVVDEEYGKLP